MNVSKSSELIACEGKAPIRGALEDTLVVAAFAGFSGLLAAGAPTWSVLYAVGLTAALAGIVTYARLRNIMLKG